MGGDWGVPEQVVDMAVGRCGPGGGGKLYSHTWTCCELAKSPQANKQAPKQINKKGQANLLSAQEINKNKCVSYCFYWAPALLNSETRRRASRDPGITLGNSGGTIGTPDKNLGQF